MQYDGEKREKKVTLTLKPSNFDKVKKLKMDGKIKGVSDFINYLIEDYFYRQEQHTI